MRFNKRELVTLYACQRYQFEALLFILKDQDQEKITEMMKSVVNGKFVEMIDYLDEEPTKRKSRLTCKAILTENAGMND